MTNKVNYAELIPELQKWNEKGMDIDSFLICHARFDQFIAYSRTFWPDFVEHEGCIFLSESFSPDNYKQWRRELSPAQTEAMMNHRHITDLFVNDPEPPVREAVLFIGRLLKEIWTAKLKSDFPERSFTVSFPESHSDHLNEYEISFFQNTHA